MRLRRLFGRSLPARDSGRSRTLRRDPGWCAGLKKVVDLGLLDETPVTYPAGMTFAQWTAGFIKAKGGSDGKALRQQIAKHFKADAKANFLDRWEWLGLFGTEPLPITGKQTTALDILAVRLDQKMPYKPGERDMLVLMHKFIARFPQAGGAAREERISSTMIDFGIPNGDSSMARTVSLPAAIGARLILTGAIRDTGVHAPVKPSIYNPVLDELATMNIRCVEKTEK